MKQSPPSSHLTHATGTPVTDNLNIQTAGPRDGLRSLDGDCSF
jgi:hypothetical protein